MPVQMRYVPGDALALARNMKGHFQNQRWMTEAHKHAAHEAASDMQNVLDEKVKERARRRRYPIRATRHLFRALGDPRNYRPMHGNNWTLGFMVGLPDFLDSTPAKPYWRNLEHGTTIFQRRQVVIVASSLRRKGRVSETGLRDPTKRNIPGPRVTIENAIQPYNYLEEGSARALAALEGGRMRQLYEWYSPGPLPWR